MIGRQQLRSTIRKSFQQFTSSSVVNHRFASVSSQSWAAATLASKGIPVQEVPKERYSIITSELLNQRSDKVEKLANDILNLNALESMALWKSLQSQLGVSDEEYMAALPGMMVGGGSAAPVEKAPQKAEPEPVKEKEAFDIKLGAVDAKAKIKVIKEVRTITGLGLKEAKELVEKAPVVIKQGVKKEEVEAMKKLLIEAGATVEVI